MGRHGGMQRSRYRSFIARRVILAALLSAIALIACLSALAYYVLAYLPVRTLPTTASDAQAMAAQLLPIWPLAVAAAAFMVLVLWGMSSWAVSPVEHLVTAATTLADGARMRAVGHAGDQGRLAQNFSDLSDVLIRSSRELEKQNRLMSESIGRLEQMMKVGSELSTMLDSDDLLRRSADTMHDLLGYERVAAVLVDGDMLAYHYYGADPKDRTLPRIPLRENTSAARAVATSAPVRIDDIRMQQGMLPAPGASGARAELAVPVVHGRQVLAVLLLQSATPAAFGQQDEEQLAVLAQMLASALANSSRFRDEQLRRQMAEAIYRVSQTLSGAMASDRVPELILEQLGQVLPFDRSALLFVDGDMVDTVAIRGYSTSSTLMHRRAPLNALPLIQGVVAQSRALVLEHASGDQRYRPIVGSAPAQSWLGAPLHRAGHVVGVLVLESDEPARYGYEEQAAMTAIANQAAVALENMRLYTEAQDRAQRLEVISELTSLVSTRDVLRELHSILRTAIHRIRRVVPCDYAALALYNEDDDTFSVEPVYDFSVRDWADLPAGTRQPAANTPWQMACRTAGPLLQSELRQSAFAEDRPLAAIGLRSSIVVPILGAMHPIGALTFASREPSAYLQPQLATLMELAHYLGPALYNARLHREREVVANQLAQTQKNLNLVDKVRVVGQLASGVAHDFNNLLAGILGNAQLLLYEIQDPEHRDMLRVIERASKDGSETVRRLQGFARMEHDSPMTEVRLDMLACDAIDITRPRWRDVAKSRGISIEIVRKLQPVTPIAGRASELREVLTNLIINAVDAMPKGGKITIASFDSPSEGDGEGNVVLEIADSGVGMSPEIRSRIFDPFFTTKGEQGTGLGLAVSLGIIQSHGGNIDVESEIGAGTRFIIRLPVRLPVHTPQREPQGEVPIIPGHILLVESEQMIRDALLRRLTRWGHRVTSATGGIEALRTFEPDRFDVVLSDQGMPDMSGWDLLAQIKQREAHVPTVLMTGWGRQLNEDEARERGVDFIIEKPFDQDVLRHVLAKAIGAKAT
ncbi:GAF domain-containing protein [Chloroflexia bacterium SDU3-3]|nr:GAF domain-containing protein [Chloroflexia bacterium SDU3-3]